MKFSTLSVLIGLTFALVQVRGLANPEAFKKTLLAFPRSLPWGYSLVALGTLWFLSNLSNERISDFEPYKKFMLAGFAGIGIATCVFVKDFLAARGLAIVMLLLAKLTVDSARWIETDWRLVVVTWAYIWILAGMWITISPWRLRDWFDWITQTPARIKTGCALRLTFGLLVAFLGLFLF